MTEGLGRLVNHDPRSREYEFPRAFAKVTSVSHPINAMALNQGTTNACTGFAAAQWMNCPTSMSARVRWNQRQPRQRITAFLDATDAMAIYSNNTKYDQFAWAFPPSDEGSSGIGIGKGLQKLGVIERYEWTFTFQGFLAALASQPVLIGSNWYEGMSQPDEMGLVRLHGDTMGGHQYLARGILVQEKLIRFRNSWGPGWGRRGDFYVTWEDVERLLDERGDVLVPRTFQKK